jgi:hypothetical protein
MFDIKTISVIDEDNHEKTLNMARQFGTDLTAAISKAAAKIDEYYNGQKVLSRNGLEELDDAALALRHYNAIYGKVMEAWKGTAIAFSFSKNYGGKVDDSFAEGIAMYNDLMRIACRQPR